MSNQAPARVVIIGAGFAGLWAAKGLAAAKHMEVVLIDRNNYHTFIPLLYQVAAAELEPEQIAYPIRGIFRQNRNVRTVLAEVCSVDPEKRIVHTDGLDYPYDYLVVAPGSQTAFFDVPGAQEHALTLKSLEDAVTLRNRLLSCFEMAAQMEREDRPEGLLQVAVVGAGATGVEYAGALAELMKTPLARDFPEFCCGDPKVILIDRGELPLAGFPEKLRVYTEKRLKKMGVHIYANSAVAQVTPEAVILTDGTRIPAYTTVWNAGIRGHDVAGLTGLPLGRGGRVNVKPSLQVEEYPEVFVAGDLALLEGQSPPTVAPNATQQGMHVAANILRMHEGKATRAFVYRDKGSMVTIGRSSAVARIGAFSFTGFIAWALWLVVHLAFLIGFRNRIFVFINWAWDYLFFERAVRLILPRDESIACVYHDDDSDNSRPPSSPG